MHDLVARLLKLRLRFRNNPAARAYVDRALLILAEAAGGDPDFEALDQEAFTLAESLSQRFDPPRKVRVH